MVMAKEGLIEPSLFPGAEWSCDLIPSFRTGKVDQIAEPTPARTQSRRGRKRQSQVTQIRKLMYLQYCRTFLCKENDGIQRDEVITIECNNLRHG